MNYHVGFGNWSLNLASRQVKTNNDAVTVKITVEISVPSFNIQCSGTGSFSSNKKDGNESKGRLYTAATKLAYVKACSDAFHRIVLVVLPTGKCFPVQVDTEEILKLDVEVNERMDPELEEFDCTQALFDMLDLDEEFENTRI